MSSNESPQSRELRLQYLEAMGIRSWELRSVAAQAPVPAPDPAPVVPGSGAGQEKPAGQPQETGHSAISGSELSGMDWAALQARVTDCTLCDLHVSRTRTVFGTGNRSADWLVIGEAPGRDEDLQGEPFVGRAGQLLTAMLRAIGLERGQVFIANILKCRPPDNRDPHPDEVSCCEPYLMRQIELVQPGIILAVGRIAAQNLLQTDTPIGKLRGQVHRFRATGIPLVATYHPAYLLRSPLEKRKVWQDLQMAVRALQGQSL